MAQCNRKSASLLYFGINETSMHTNILHTNGNRWMNLNLKSTKLNQLKYNVHSNQNHYEFRFWSWFFFSNPFYFSYENWMNDNFKLVARILYGYLEWSHNLMAIHMIEMWKSALVWLLFGDQCCWIRQSAVNYIRKKKTQTPTTPMRF